MGCNARLGACTQGPCKYSLSFIGPSDVLAALPPRPPPLSVSLSLLLIDLLPSLLLLSLPLLLLPLLSLRRRFFLLLFLLCFEPMGGMRGGVPTLVRSWQALRAAISSSNLGTIMNTARQYALCPKPACGPPFCSSCLSTFSASSCLCSLTGPCSCSCLRHRRLQVHRQGKLREAAATCSSKRCTPNQHVPQRARGPPPWHPRFLSLSAGTGAPPRAASFAARSASSSRR